MRPFTLTAPALAACVALAGASTIPVIDLRQLDGLHRPWLPQSLRMAEYRIRAQAYWEQLAAYNRLLETLNALRAHPCQP
jgi:hypothetical protein